MLASTASTVGGYREPLPGDGQAVPDPTVRPPETSMRMKDALTVARVLGRELRDAAPEEVAGIEVAIGAVRGHMEHVHGGDFDPEGYDAAVDQGRRGELGW